MHREVRLALADSAPVAGVDAERQIDFLVVEAGGLDRQRQSRREVLLRDDQTEWNAG